MAVTFGQSVSESANVSVSAGSSGIKFNFLNLDWDVVSSSPKWSKIAKEYIEYGLKGKITLTVNGTEIVLPPLYILSYLRSMSKLIIHSSLELYKKRNKIENSDLIITSTGSDNPTSDYDFSVFGRGSAELIKLIYDSFKETFPSKIIPLSYDSNGYPGPMFLLYPVGHRFYKPLPEWIKYYIIQSFGDNKQCIPLPISDDAIRKESKAVLDKLSTTKRNVKLISNEHDEHDVEEYDDKYKKLVESASIIETFLYPSSDEEQIIKTEEDYWDYLIKVSQNSIESYHTVSCMITVVIILQMKQIGIRDKISRNNWLIAALENISDLIEHEGIIVDEYGNYMISDDNTHIIHTSKYVYRILKCLENVSEIYPEDGDEFTKIAELVVKLRGKTLSGEPEELERYKSLVLPLLLPIFTKVEEIVLGLSALAKEGGNRGSNIRQTRKISHQSKKLKSRRVRIH